MTWHAEPDASEETWADTLFRTDDGGRLLWLRAGDGVEGSWAVQDIDASEGVATVREEREVSVSDAVALAPENERDILRLTRSALARYVERYPEGGVRLAGELDDALRELEREDVPGTGGGGHTKRPDELSTPIEYRGE